MPLLHQWRQCSKAASALLHVRRSLGEARGKSHKKQAEKMHHFGETLADIVMPALDTVETESSLELNFFIGKLKHSVRRVKRANTADRR